MFTVLFLLMIAMKIIACIFFLLISSVHVLAQWVQTSGPSGGGVSDFAFVNGKLLAATFDLGNGVYASTDSGTTWHESGLQNIMLTHIAAFNSTVITATTHNSYNETDEIYRSSDGGDSWQSVLSVPNINGVRSLCHFKNLWFFTAQGQNGGLFISSDDGMSWVHTVPASFNFTHPIPLVSTDSYLIAGTDHDGVPAIFRSPNGTQWEQLKNGPDSVLHSQMHCGVFSGNVIWLGLTGGVMYSADGGNSWTFPRNANLTHSQDEYFASIAVSGNHLIAVSSLNIVYYSWDGGGHWTKASYIGLPANASYFFSLYLLNNIYFLGSSSGILKSQNDFLNWHYSTDGLRAVSVSQLGANNGRIFAATERGVSVSSDVGTVWRDPQTLEDLNDVPISGFVNGHFIFYAFGSGIYSWNGPGSFWTMIDSTTITALAEGASERLFASRESNDPIAGTGGIFFSDNGGAKWDSLLLFTNTFDTEFYFLPQCISTHGSTVIAVQRAIAFQTFTSSYFIYRSSDNGTSWQNTKVMNSPSFVNNFDGIFYLGTLDSGLFQSNDDGITWSPKGFNTKSGVTSFLKITDWLFATVAGNGNIADGIYKMGNDGAGWRFANGGTTNIMGPLATDGTFLYSGGPSVWKRRLSELGVNSVQNTPSQNTMLESYPNPAGDILHLRVNSSDLIHGSLIITDEKGSTALNQQITMNANDGEVTFSLTSFVPGAYYVKLVDKSGYEIGCSRFVVIRK